MQQKIQEANTPIKRLEAPKCHYRSGGIEDL